MADMAAAWQGYRVRGGSGGVGAHKELRDGGEEVQYLDGAPMAAFGIQRLRVWKVTDPYRLQEDARVGMEVEDEGAQGSSWGSLVLLAQPPLHQLMCCNMT